MKNETISVTVFHLCNKTNQSGRVLPPFKFLAIVIRTIVVSLAVGCRQHGERGSAFLLVRTTAHYDGED